MKKYVCLLTVLYMCVIPAGAVFAQEEPQNTAASYTEDARAARISNLRSTYKINLSDKEKNIVSSRCQEAQKSLARIGESLKTTHTKRSNDYTSVIALMASLSALFQKEQIDSSNLDLLVVSYQQKKVLFEERINAYQTALDDIVSISCSNEPENFRAALEGVRAARKDVVAVTADIQETTRASLKTTFDSLRLRLETRDQ